MKIVYIASFNIKLGSFFLFLNIAEFSKVFMNGFHSYKYFILKSFGSFFNTYFICREMFCLFNQGISYYSNYVWFNIINTTLFLLVVVDSFNNKALIYILKQLLPIKVTLIIF